jgi:hypothetical protein
VGEGKFIQNFSQKSMTERDYLGNLGVDGVVLKRILKKPDACIWTEFVWLEIGTSGGLS